MENKNEEIKNEKNEDNISICSDNLMSTEYNTFENKKAATNNDIQWTELECIEHPFPFTNTKGTELPSTGGIGTTIFYTLGGILILGAGVLLVSRKRMTE